MQEKLNKLTNLIKLIKSESARNLALSILSDLIKIINDQEMESKALYSRLSKNKISDIDCELNKYVMLLIYHGYSQLLINLTREQSIKFLMQNKDKIQFENSNQLKTLDQWLMNFELEFERMPKNYDEFKTYYQNARA